MSGEAVKEGTTLLCRLEEIEDGTAKGFSVATPTGPLDVLVVREGARAYGYINSCPHVGTPLDWRPDEFMSEDGSHLQCATHGALFRIEDGFCIAGPCAGDRLEPVALAIEPDGRIFFRGDGTG